MKAILPLLALGLISCAATKLPSSRSIEGGQEAGAKSTRYPALTDSRISAGGSFAIHYPGFEKKLPPTAFEAEAMRLCRNHLTKWGFTSANKEPVDFVVQIKFEVLTVSGRTAQVAKVHLWENKAPSYAYLWKSAGVALGDPQEAKLAALQSALSRFPN